MRIVQLLSQTHLTGAEAHAHCLAEGLKAQGYDVTIISDRWHLSTPATIISRPIHSARGWQRLREIFWLRRFLKENHIDIVHTHSRAAVRIGWWATRGLPTALVSTIHGRQHFSWGKRLFDTYGERVIAICGALKKHLVTDFQMREHRVRVLGNPLTLPASTPTLSHEGQRWLFVTRWTGPKGQRALEFLRHLAPVLLEQNPGLHLHLAGVPPDPISRAALHIEELRGRFGDRIRHLGFKDPVEALFPSYDLILGGGRIALAALALEKPCFAFGEAETCGLIDRENFEAAVFSNFGDINLSGCDLPLDLVKAQRDFSRVLNGHRPDTHYLAVHIRQDFLTESVTREIIEIYRSARFLKRYRRPIPVLMYHKVVEEPLDTPHRIFVTAETFRRHLQTLRRRGCTSLTFADLKDFKEGTRPWSEFPRRPVILTFDDGYLNNLTLAAPLLKEFDFKAVIYLLADSSLSANSWDEGAAPQVPLMNPEERRRLNESGVFEIGSHGFRHERLPGMNEAQALMELRESKRRLETEFGREILSFAFTYGDIDQHSADLARQAGYHYAVNTDRGGLLLEEDPFAVFRINVFPEDGPAVIRKKTSWWYRWRYYFKRGR